MSILPAEPSPGYSSVSKYLHWGIFFLMAAQFFVGYSIERLDDDSGLSEDRLFAVHVFFGLLILLLSVFRIWWRRARPLPPWAPTLSSFERRYAHQVERALYVLMVGIPLTGLGYAFTDERRLPLIGRVDFSELFEDAKDFFEVAHIGSHVLFFLFFPLHVGLILKHQLVDRDRLLSRML